MDFIERIYNIVPEVVWSVISYVGTAFAILFLYFSAKHQNRKLEIKWYVLAFFFPSITSMVYLSKSKQYNKSVGMKVCPCCGDRYYPNYEICSRCLVELPEVDAEKSGLYKKLSRIFLCLFIGVFLLDFVAGAVTVSKVIDDGFSELDGIFEEMDEDSDRISFKNSKGDDVYYDRNGEESYDTLDLPVYDRDGVLYCFVFEEGELCFYKDEGADEWLEENLLKEEFSFVDEEGYFVYLEENPPVQDVEAVTDAEYYFDAPYKDSEGNLYYPALLASWTPDGELVTSREQME